MNKTKILIISLLFCSMAWACSEDSKKDKIIGKWRGTYANSCADPKYVLGPATVEIEFNKNGQCVSVFTSYGEDEKKSIPVVMTYAIQGDSIVYISEDRTTAFINYLSDDKLLTKQINFILDTTGNCIGTTYLEKIKD